MNKARAGKKPKRTKWLIALGVALLLYTIVGFLVVPAIIKSQMLKILPGLTKRQVAVADVKCNPYALSLTIDGFSLKETNGEVFSSFGQLYVNFQLSSIFKRCFVFDEISLRDAFAQATYLKDGTFNFANLIPPPSSAPAPQKPSPPPPVLVYHLLITNAVVAFADLTREPAFNLRYQPINVSLTDITTLRDRNSPYEIAATGDSGERFAWKGDVTVNPLRSSGTFRLDGLKLKKFQPYSRDYARFTIADGQVDAGLDYRYDSASNALDLDVSNAFMTLAGFQLKSDDASEDLVTLPSLSIKQVRASVLGRTAEIGEIKSSGGSLRVRRNADGAINLLAALVPHPAAAPAATPPPPAPAWSAKVDEIAFDHYAIKVEDRTTPKPAVFNIGDLGFDLKNISLASNAPLAVALSLRLQETGSIAVNGSATLLPPTADLQIGLTNLDLRMIQPYLDQQLKMAITRGALNLNGRARYAPEISFDGDVSVNNFSAADEVRFEELASWDALAVTGIRAGLSPLKVHIDKIQFSGSTNNVIIGPDHRLNVLTILPDRAPSTNAPANPAPATPLPEITLGEFAFERTSLHFTDRSIEPNCVFAVEEAGGSLKDISSKITTPSALDVKGRIDEFSSFNVSGQINPMPDNLFVDVAVAFTNMGLTAFSPYTEKFAGRPLQKGKLSFALRYKIDHTALDAQNGIFIDQLTLGPKNGSTNATHLPVKLAIALLKDRKGRIKLDVPVQGHLNDPKFKLAPVIWGVVENLIVKAATAPFSLLGAMFGGGDELSFVAFDPGQAAIPAAETNKLNTLVKALYDRPELTMEINGSVDPAKDRDVMAWAKFQKQIKTLFARELAAAGKPATAVDDLTVPPADYARLVTSAYTNAFGTNTVPATNAPPTNSPAPVVKNLPPPAPQFTHAGSRQMSELRHEIPVAAPTPATNATVTVPVAGSPVDLATMEKQLVQKVEITSDDFRQLMQDRAKKVEAFLLQDGKVTADRLFITTPKPLTPATPGQDRVNLTLD